MKRVMFTLAFLAAMAGACADNIAFFEKTYKVKLTGIKPIGEYPDPDQFYTAIAEELGIPELAYAALKEECGWKQQEGQLLYPMIKRGANSDRWGFMFCRVLLNEEKKRPDVSTLETRMLEIDDAGKVYFHGSDTQITETMLKDLLKAIDVYVSDVGSTPTRLENLVVNPGDENWKGPYWKGRKKIADPWGKQIDYQIADKHVVLVSSGPDRTMGTKDDIRISQ